MKVAVVVVVGVAVVDVVVKVDVAVVDVVVSRSQCFGQHTVVK